MGPSGFLFTLRVYWEDTDAGGVVFYANYLRFFERARTEWLRSLGVSQEAMRREGRMFVVTDTAVRYCQPARLDDALVVSAALDPDTPRGRASLQLVQQAWRDAHLLAEGRIRIGCVRVADWRPCRIPQPILDRMPS